VTRIVSRLEGEGLVRRLSAPGAQAVRAELTEAGQVRLDAAMDIHFAGVQRLFSSRTVRGGVSDTRVSVGPAGAGLWDRRVIVLSLLIDIAM